MTTPERVADGSLKSVTKYSKNYSIGDPFARAAVDGDAVDFLAMIGEREGDHGFLAHFIISNFRKFPIRAAASQFALSTPYVVQCSLPSGPTARAMITTW